MAVVLVTTDKFFVGLSSDEKPTDVPAGAIFVELDTRRRFLFDGETYLRESQTPDDDSQFRELADSDTAYSFYEPEIDDHFLITGIRAKAGMDVNPTMEATVIVYEASSASSAEVARVLYEEPMVRGESYTLIPLRIGVTAGSYVNAKTTEGGIQMSIMGHFVDGIEA